MREILNSNSKTESLDEVKDEKQFFIDMEYIENITNNHSHPLCSWTYAQYENILQNKWYLFELPEPSESEEYSFKR